MKKWMIAACAVLLLLAVPSAVLADNEEDSDDTAIVHYYKGTVLLVETITYEEDDTLAYDEINQISQIEIEKGPFAGRVYTIENNVCYSDPQQIVLHVGDKVMLSAQLTDDGTEISSVYIYDYYRISQIWIGIIITAVILIGVGFFKEAQSICVDPFCYFKHVLFFIPLIKSGHPAILLMIPICLVVVMINIIWDVGLNTRGFSAFIGVGIGLLLAAISGFLFENSASLVGLGETELNMLYYVSDHVSLDYTGLMTACTMLIALGPVLDGCIDLVQEMSTLRETNPYIGKTEALFVRFEKWPNLYEPKHQYHFFHGSCVHASDVDYFQCLSDVFCGTD
jgi:uncharacterized membrane protein